MASCAATWLWVLLHDAHLNIRLIPNTVIMRVAATDGMLAICQAACWGLYSFFHPTDIYWISTMWQNWCRFQGTVRIKQCSWGPRTFQEEEKENRRINMEHIRWWLGLQRRKWDKGASEGTREAHCPSEARREHTWNSGTHWVDWLTATREIPNTLGIQASKWEGVRWTYKRWIVLGDLGEGSWKQDFALNWILSGSEGNSTIGHLGNSYLGGGRKVGQWIIVTQKGKCSPICGLDNLVLIWIWTWWWRGLAFVWIHHGPRVSLFDVGALGDCLHPKTEQLSCVCQASSRAQSSLNLLRQVLLLFLFYKWGNNGPERWKDWC